MLKEQLQAQVPDAVESCHPLAHAIVDYALHQFSLKFAVALAWIMTDTLNNPTNSLIARSDLCWHP